MSVGSAAYHRTKIALVKVTFDLLIASHNRLVSLNVLVGLRVAFDMTGPSILMQRLELVFEAKYATLEWFRSYSLERFQFVHVNDVLYPTKVYHTSLLQLDVDTGFCTLANSFDLLQNSLRKCFLTACNKFQCYTDDTQPYLSPKPGGNTAINLRVV